MSETLTRTICIKLDGAGNDAALTKTQRQFNAAASWIAAVCWQERITNTNTAHHRVYGETRTRFGLGAQLSVCARAKAMEAIKAVKAQDVAETEEAIGVDLGIVSIATASTGQHFTGASLRKARSRYVARRAALQRVRTKAAKRRLKQMSGRERRYMKDINHRISKTLVHQAVVSRKALALEDLTGIRERVTVRREHRYERHAWAFYQLRAYITYKAAWAGVEVRLVDPAYTSQTCSRCGHCERANRQSQASFLCKQCGFCCQADVNAAINISLAASQAANGSAGTSAVTSPRL